MQKFLMLLGALFLALIIIGGGLFGYLTYKGRRYDAESQQFIDRAVPEIAAKWDPAVFYRYADLDRMVATGSKSEFEHFLADLSKLGPLTLYDGSRGEAILNWLGDEKSVSALYISHIVCKSGTAEMQTRLLREPEGWKIVGIHINSPVLASPSPGR